MAIPKIRELYNPILDYLYKFGESSLADIRIAMARSFYIPDKEAFNYNDNDDNKPTLFMGRVNNACYNLYFAGLIIRVRRGVYDISPKGHKAVDDEDFVDSDYLWMFPAYQEYATRRYEQGVCASGPEEEDNPLPIPNPNVDDFPEVRPERPELKFRQVELLTIEDMVELRDHDARFANMIASGDFLYDDGIIKRVPREVLQHDMSYAEFKATTLMHSAGQAIMCYQEANTGKMISAPEPTPEGFHRTKRGSRPWSNPYPPAPTGGSGSGGTGTGGNGPGGNGGGGGTGGYNGNRNYDMVQDMLNYIQQSNRDFNACFVHLMDIYNIKEGQLVKISGVDQKKIQRMRNDSTVHVNVEDLTAIMLALKASSHILDAFIDLIGLNPASIKYKPYSVICDTMKYANYEEVNDACRKANLPEVFPANLSGPIS